MKSFHLALKPAGPNGVIAVQAGDELTPSRENARIVGMDRAAIAFVPDVADSWVSTFVNDGCRVISGSVIDDDDFIIPECLAGEAIECARKQMAAVVSRHDDGNDRRRPFSSVGLILGIHPLSCHFSGVPV